MANNNSGRSLRKKYNEFRDLIVASYAYSSEKSFDVVRAKTATAGSLMTLLAVKETVVMSHDVVLNTFYKDMARWLVTETDGLTFMRCFLCNAVNRSNPKFVSIMKDEGELDGQSRLEHDKVARTLESVFTSPISRILMPHMSKLIESGGLKSRDFSWISVYPKDDTNFQLLHHWFLAEFFFDWLPNMAINLSVIYPKTIDELHYNFLDVVSAGNVFALQVAQHMVDKSLLYDSKIFSTIQEKFAKLRMPRPIEHLGSDIAADVAEHPPFEKLVHLIVLSLPEILAFQINLGILWFFIYYFKDDLTTEIISKWMTYLKKIGFTKYRMTSDNHIVQFAALAEPDSVAGVLQKVEW